MKRQKAKIGIIALFIVFLISGKCSYGQEDPWKFFDFWGSKSNGSRQLVANTNTVVWGPTTSIISIATDSTNLASTNSSTFTDYINTGNYSRIRQGYGLANDVLTKVRLYIGDYAAITYAQVRIWRRNQITGTFTLVGSARINPTSNGTQDFDISISNVKEGDFIGLRLKTTAAAFNIRSGNANLTVLKKDNADSTNVTFSTTVANSYVPTIVSGNAPAIVFTGNSLTGGSPLHYPYTYASQISQVDYTWATYPNYTCYKYGITYQNYSFPGSTSQIILDNISYIIALHPVWVFLENTNDVNDTTSLTAIALQRAIIDSLTAHGIKVAYWQIPPRNSHNAIMFRRDTIIGNISGYTIGVGGIVFNSGPLLGTQKVTGLPAPPVPNYWTIITGYSPDGLHFYEGSYRIVGGLADSVLQTRHTLTDTTLIIHAHNPVYDTTEYGTIAISDTIHSYPDLDSAVIHYSVNGGAYSTSKMAITDSTALTNSYNCYELLSVDADNNDSVRYYIAGYYGTKTGTSNTNSFRYGKYSPYTTNKKIELWPDSNFTRSEWQSTVDTLKFRQGTGANQPYYIAGMLGNGRGVIRFDSTHYMLCASVSTNAKNYTFIAYYKYIGTNGLGGYIIGGTGQGIVSNFDVTSSGWGNTFSSGNYLITNPDTDTNWASRVFTADHLYKNGVEPSYKTQQTSSAMTFRCLGTRPDATTLYGRFLLAYFVYYEETLTEEHILQQLNYVDQELGL